MTESYVFMPHTELAKLVESTISRLLENYFKAKPSARPDFHEGKKYMNIEETAEYTRMAKQTIYQMVSSRRIPHIKKGKRLLFEKAEIDNWLSTGKKITYKDFAG